MARELIEVQLGPSGGDPGFMRRGSPAEFSNYAALDADFAAQTRSRAPQHARLPCRAFMGLSRGLRPRWPRCGRNGLSGKLFWKAALIAPRERAGLWLSAGRMPPFTLFTVF